jgi:hypothetical protein
MLVSWLLLQERVTKELGKVGMVVNLFVSQSRKIKLVPESVGKTVSLLFLQSNETSDSGRFDRLVNRLL